MCVDPLLSWVEANFELHQADTVENGLNLALSKFPGISVELADSGNLEKVVRRGWPAAGGRPRAGVFHLQPTLCDLRWAVGL